MHEDERRDQELRQRMLLEDFAANFEEMHRKYSDLVDRQRQSRQIRHLESQRELRLGKLEQENEMLTRKLAKANWSLEAYRKETKRLKDDLKRVRSSRSMRIGKAVTRSLSVFRRGSSKRGTTSVSAQRTEAFGRPEALPADNTSHEGAISRGSSTVAGAVSELATSSLAPLWELTYEELEARLEVEPRTDVLSALLNRAWFQRGDISMCEKLLNGHPELVNSLPDQGKELVARIHGAARLRRSLISVPSRSHDAAYRVEVGRVMYCVHSTPVYDSNGYSTRTRGLVEGLSDSGVDVSVVSRIGYPWDVHCDSAPRNQEREVVELGGVEYVHTPGADLNRDPLDEYILKAADAYVREAKIRRPQRIHAASNFRQALPALIAARRLGVPFVYEVRGLWEFTEAASKKDWERSERFALHVEMENLVATEADHVLAITAQVRDELIARGADPERVTLAPNAVNVHEFVPLPADDAYARSIGVSLDRPVIGFAGSLVGYEGLDVLLKSAKIIHDRGIPAQVVIAGSGAAATELRALTSQLGLQHHVTFLGRISAEMIPRLMSIMDVMPCPRLPTRVTELVSPLKPLESLAAGKVVVLSDVSPQADLIPPGSGRGFLVPAGDPEALADALSEALLDPELSRAVSRAGRLWTVRERTWKALSFTIRSAYEDADRNWKTALSKVPHRPLSQIRLGVVADEFTTETLRHRVQLVPISRRDPLAALDKGLDAVFVESAWEGNGGEWFHGVGYYGDEQFAALNLLLHSSAESGIPRIFWNKEDPVHYRRFIPTAVHFDHIFTTDGALLGDYLAAGGSTVRTASALPFYAEPTLHNPVQSPTDLSTSTAMYAGTYYGKRYATRSKELQMMLRAAMPHGLTIYDRQHGKSDSPYRFPQEFSSQVSGSLPYRKVLDAYRSHSVSLNVNSVTDSPTMFSRRVVEAAASGGVVLSGPGRGVVETFGGAIPTSADFDFHRAMLRAWQVYPAERFNEAWFQLRVVARSHTTETALAIMLRTAGIAVDGLRDPRYIALLPNGPEAARAVLSQSVRPEAIAVPEPDVASVQMHTDLPVLSVDCARAWAHDAHVEALITFTASPSRTLAEDLLIAHRFRGDTNISAREYVSGDDDPRLLAAPTSELPIAEHDSVVGTFALLDEVSNATTEGSSLTLVVPPASKPTKASLPTALGEEVPLVSKGTENSKNNPRTVLVAGHDLKFLTSYMAALEAEGHTVLIDYWTGHSGHDEQKSKLLLDQADVVWCEWGLGNAVWYSHHIVPNQRLVVRVHLQELELPYLRKVRMDAVDSFVFVGELVQRAAVESHGVPPERTVVIPNIVRTETFARPKSAGAAHTLGLVGIVPQRKRLDLAIDLVERLREADPRFCLRVKGKRPEEYSWMENRLEEMQYYREQYERIDRLNADAGEDVVQFDSHGSDMADWYQKIGVVVSVSDFESFHLTLPDGAVSGADAVSLAWAGADLIYPDSMLFADVTSMAAGILDERRRRHRRQEIESVLTSFDEHIVYRRFSDLLFGGASQRSESVRYKAPSVAREASK